MKIRTDFVTNSSSSSFVVIHVDSHPLKTFMDENNIAPNFFEMLVEQIEEPYACSPDIFNTRHNAAEALLYFIDFACMVENDEWDVEEINHFPSKFCDIGTVPAEKVELLYHFIYNHEGEINGDPMLIANLLAIEIATDGGGEGSYYELRAEQGKQMVAILDLWEDVMSPLYDNDEDEAADKMIDEIACGEANLWEVAQQKDTIKEL